jgi:predicted DNA-binding mobile mystery protein A
MTTSDLGTRMGVSSTSVLGLEANERAGKAGLDTLRRAADALDCDLVYLLVPRRALTAVVEDRARMVAQTMIGSVEHSMLLEDQRVAASTAREQLDELARKLQDQPGLWRDV